MNEKLEPDYNMPNDNLGADIYLNARKEILMELAALISSDKIGNIYEVSVFVWDNIKVIDRRLEGEI